MYDIIFLIPISDIDNVGCVVTISVDEIPKHTVFEIDNHTMVIMKNHKNNELTNIWIENSLWKHVIHINKEKIEEEINKNSKITDYVTIQHIFKTQIKGK